ncbi:hypothetical protein G6O69_00335 [Pseudenhygromyxa sp. WMMC2535]|uniref:hypothetical protein n=1 Tax=Pseudenhygromyxa sp. WMMC2535 TaxID=2712867 RepID=UPI001595701A|nr:hypothetical protein [Pseudenhygromyxa sp. WMMC2535]NVB36257.1 hypothetical protein [Pseudenhygromyxa sp. WMMC2535]
MSPRIRPWLSRARAQGFLVQHLGLGHRRIREGQGGRVGPEVSLARRHSQNMYL